MKYFVLFSLTLACICACKKDKEGCVAVKPEDEAGRIERYIAADSLAVVRRSSQIYFKVLDEGYGPSPTANSQITVTYTGKLLDGTIFDERSSPITVKLADMIEGWQIGLPQVKKGGEIVLILPSAYGYGCVGRKPLTSYEKDIPPNSILYFDIHLIDVR